VGSGLPYGTVLAGAGAEIEIPGRVSLLGGVGVGRDTPWAYGLRVYVQPPGRSWRPHASVLRWTEGHGVYLGVDHDIGTPGRFVATYGLGFGDVNLEGRVGAMAGLGYRW
jgi:hypothetical protein